VNEAIDRLIVERGKLDSGLSSSFVASLAGHVILITTAVAVPFLMPRQPLLQVTSGFAVTLPRGGGGAPQPPTTQPPAQPKPAEPAPTVAPPKVLKPPREQPRPDALPEPDSRVRARRPTPAPPKAAAAGSTTPGLEFGPAGPGVPDGTDSGGDWYLAGVQQKIWTLWNQQIKSGFNRPIGVTFTILTDGSVTDVEVTQPSGVALLDMAAQRAILNAAPFGPLPREYGTNRRTIRALFRPADG
jgi:protein TonB